MADIKRKSLMQIVTFCVCVCLCACMCVSVCVCGHARIACVHMCTLPEVSILWP